MLSDFALPAWVGAAGPTAGLGLAVVLALMRGWLVPRWTMDARAHDWKERLGEARADAAIWRAIALERTAQVTELVRLAQTTERVVAALPAAVDPGQGE